MFTFTKLIGNAAAYEQILDLTNKIKQITMPNGTATVKQNLRETLTPDTVFGYVRMENNILTSQEILDMLRYNDSKDAQFTHFSVWYEVDFVFVDFLTRRIMCWGLEKNVKDALNGIQDLVQGTIKKKVQAQKPLATSTAIKV
jgi:hypothetical protein